MNTRPARLFVALSMTIALAGCQKLTGAAADNTPELKVGDTVAGEITSTSRLNYNDGSRHQSYKVTLKSGEALSLELGGALNGQLAVFDGQSMLAKASTGSYEGEGDSTSTSGVSLAFRAPKDGSFLVAVNSAGADSFGPFKLKTATVVPYDGKPLAAGSQAIDWLMSKKQEYALKVDKPGLYSIKMESSAIDAFLNLNGRNVEVEDDDSGGQLNARIQAYLEPGDYTIGASSMNETTGSFKLSVALTPTEGNLVTRDGTALTIGQTAPAMMDSRGRRTFVLNLESAKLVQFDAIADGFDSVLKISGPGVDAEDDDGGNGTNAQLIQSLKPGRYIVEVRSLNGQGVFELETTDLGGDAATPANSNRKDAASEAAAEAASASADAAVIQ
ncbi:ABC transporter substrate-binding protein [Stenotrophomonas sp. SY1]|uniref:ABC transporter substrate-binding protein n=1 Tax=Stenotrophomonas sp. SY1 TaxID=477235 RepID=UPI001E6254D0|nr:ABC transporter substrate-binding protein [Stenotrophomonas sp. SY1]MCD9087211.1 ABC transporter substrate-binding protein [Stenotrophomonas sp. SY1]